MMFKGRILLAQLIFSILGIMLVYRLVEVQFFYVESEEIAKIKQQQINRAAETNYRINLLDRHGEELAVSVESHSLYAANQIFLRNSPERRQFLLDYLAGIGKLRENLKFAPEGISLLAPELTEDELRYVNSLDVLGLWSDLHYKRYYPAGEAAAPLLGFVGSDNQGLEGLELLYEHRLRAGQPRFGGLRDGRGRLIKLERPAAQQLEEGLRLSLDLQLQYMAYRHLVAGCRASSCSAGVIITLDSSNGEVLALAQYPSFNPNNRKALDLTAVRNRALTDLFEPGSTFKPLVLAAVMQQQDYQLDELIDTSPGRIEVDDVTVRDLRDYGSLSVAEVIAKSSNVGMAKLAAETDSINLLEDLYRLGVGRYTGSQFPGEREGYLPFAPLTTSGRAVLSYGYGVSLTPMQLTKSYGILANGGKDFYVTFMKGEDGSQSQVVAAEVAAKIKQTLKMVVSSGTGRRAQINGYSLAGKTGTVHKHENGAYSSSRYVAFFVGMAPYEQPRFVTLVMLDEPNTNNYYGGEAAAPIFAAYMQDLFHIYGIAPDVSQLAKVN